MRFRHPLTGTRGPHGATSAPGAPAAPDHRRSIEATTSAPSPGLPPGRRRGARYGAAAAEFAVVAPAFFLFIFAMIEFGRGLMVLHLLNNAARMGCRVAVLTGSANADATAAVASAVTGQGLSGYAVTVKVNGSVADASTAASGDKITVVVTVPVRNVSWLPGTGYLSGNLAGECSMRRE